MLAFAAPALGRVVPIKEDPDVEITAYRRVPPDAIEGLTGQRLRNKVLRYQREFAPREHDIVFDWYVFAECDGRLILRPQLLTPNKTQLRIECGQ